MDTPLSVAVIGIGNIGRYLVRSIRDGAAGPTRIVAIADRSGLDDRLRDLASECDCAWTTDPLSLPAYHPSIVIEAAGPDAVREYLLPLLYRRMNVFVMSAGAFANPEFLAKVRNALVGSQCRVYVPSGAIGGLDALRAASMDGLKELRLRTCKPPAGLKGAPWFDDHPIDWSRIASPTVVFRGSVEEAVRGFPNNVNVAAVLQLATCGVVSIVVEVVVDPCSDHNVHEIYMAGAFGEMTVRVANVPSLVNPKTSHLACLSPLALLRRLSTQFVVGS